MLITRHRANEAQERKKKNVRSFRRIVALALYADSRHPINVVATRFTRKPCPVEDFDFNHYELFRWDLPAVTPCRCSGAPLASGFVRA